METNSNLILWYFTRSNFGEITTAILLIPSSTPVANKLITFSLSNKLIMFEPTKPVDPVIRIFFFNFLV